MLNAVSKHQNYCGKNGRTPFLFSSSVRISILYGIDQHCIHIFRIVIHLRSDNELTFMFNSYDLMELSTGIIEQNPIKFIALCKNPVCDVVPLAPKKAL